MTHTAQAHSDPSQTAKMKPFMENGLINSFCKKLSQGGLNCEEFQLWLKFTQLNRDEISSLMLSDNNLKKESRLYAIILSQYKPS